MVRHSGVYSLIANVRKYRDYSGNHKNRNTQRYREILWLPGFEP
jgi:hypothetical protein